MAIENLDPAGGNFTLTSNTGPTTATYTPNTTADYTGDGDVDSFHLYKDISAIFEGGTSGFYDTNATANQVITFDVLMTTDNANARYYIGSAISDVGGIDGSKNGTEGTYSEFGPGYIKFGNLIDGTRYTFGQGLTSGTLAYFTLTYDPAADTAQLDWYSDAGRTTLVESSGALDMSIGPDSLAGGVSTFQAMDTAPRGKGAALYQYKISNVDFNESAGVTVNLVSGAIGYTGQAPSPVVAPPPKHVNATLQDSGGTAIPDGVKVLAFLATDFATGTANSIGNDVTSGGTGSVSVQVSTSSDCVLVADLLNSSVPLGEVVITDIIVPV